MCPTCLNINIVHEISESHFVPKFAGENLSRMNVKMSKHIWL